MKAGEAAVRLQVPLKPQAPNSGNNLGNCKIPRLIPYPFLRRPNSMVLDYQTEHWIDPTQ